MGRNPHNVLGAVPDNDFLNLLLKRMRVERKRVQAQERQRRHREKLARVKRQRAGS